MAAETNTQLSHGRCLETGGRGNFLPNTEIAILTVREKVRA
jgi:hypothetical protein